MVSEDPATRPGRPALVLAVGNPLLGDDGFGARVLQHLRQAYPEVEAAAELCNAHTDLLGQLDRFAEHQLVILLDAVQGVPGAAAGEVRVFDEPAFSGWTTESPGAHQMTPLLALRLFRLLWPAAPTRIVIVGLCVEGLAPAGGPWSGQRGDPAQQGASDRGAAESVQRAAVQVARLLSVF